jgi:membrane protease YdiL (CAAX protease family)
MANDRSERWWRADDLLPAIFIICPFFLNKLIYLFFPSYPVFVATDYACRVFGLTFLYLLVRGDLISLPIPWRLAAPSAKELLMSLIGTIILIGSNVIGTTFIRYLNAHSWRLTKFPSPTNSTLQYFDGTVGMVFVGLSEEAIFRFYLINLLLLRGVSPAWTVIVSTVIFGGIHWSYGAGAVLFAMLAGLIFSWIFMSARNLIAPIVTHAAFDAFYFAGGVAVLWRFYMRQ